MGMGILKVKVVGGGKKKIRSEVENWIFDKPNDTGCLE